MKYVFLKWWLLLCSTLGGCWYLFTLDLFNKLWEVDLSKMSFVTIALFAVTTLFIGYKTWRVSRKNTTNEDWRKAILDLPGMWFYSEAMMIFGMMGTVIGFIIALHTDIAHFTGHELQVLQQMVSGISTACLATLVGLVTMVLTRQQLNWLERFINEEEIDNGE